MKVSYLQMKIKCPDEYVELLLRAVVIKAVRDYRLACRRLKRLPYDFDAKELKEEAEEFFLSEDFVFFTSVKGEKLLQMLQDESEEKYGIC